MYFLTYVDISWRLHIHTIFRSLKKRLMIRSYHLKPVNQTNASINTQKMNNKFPL